MVLSNGPKVVRNISSLINRPTCGGNSKGGLAPTIGRFISSNPNGIGETNTQIGIVCKGNFSNQAQSELRHIRRF